MNFIYILIIISLYSINCLQINSYNNFLYNKLNRSGNRNKPLKLNDNDYLLGSPTYRPENGSYITNEQVEVLYNVVDVVDYDKEVNEMINQLDDYKGVLLTSSYEYPGRYARWTVGFVSPSIQIEGKGLSFNIISLNQYGNVLNTIIYDYISRFTDIYNLSYMSTDINNCTTISGSIIPSTVYFSEEDRSKQASLFTLIRDIKSIFSNSIANQLGLYGSFGYDLTYQFENILLNKERSNSQRDLVLYLPTEILVIDNYKNDAWKIKYNFNYHNKSLSTIQLPNEMSLSKYLPSDITLSDTEKRDYIKGTYAEQVIKAKEQFRVGNLFEVVLSQSFREKLTKNPSQIFKRLCRRNPSPYGFFMNLGRGEYLVGASPEMFVRVENTINGQRVETCPISGTIERGRDALEDAQQVKKLLLSDKEESELTMCTDVDRNDKSRICVPGSVKVLGRRQIEMYSKLIHTVDHVEGYLRPNYDSLDAFLCHTWAVTVTGAPKTWAIRFIEENEKYPRKWYGGAIGMVGFDGTLNTGLTLRTILIQDGIAEVRAGATLLYDSNPIAEELETELKASAMIDAVIRDDNIDLPFSVKKNYKDNIYNNNINQNSDFPLVIKKKVLLVDHEDSFVHTLANYIRQLDTEVITCRSGNNFRNFLTTQVDTGLFVPDLVVLSPGPGNPTDFNLKDTINQLINRKIPIFGVCLGLQGLIEYFNGELNILNYPMHGKSSTIKTYSNLETNSISIFSGLPNEFQIGRYHSLYANKQKFPNDLVILGETNDECIMAIQHKKYPIAAVQFHPESILTLPINGILIIKNALDFLKSEFYN